MRDRILKYCFFLLLSGSVPLNSMGQTAAFSANVVEGCAPLVVNFQDASQGSGLTYSWDFGNGNQSTQRNPGAIYITAGTYSVKLRVSNSSGSDSITKTAYIRVFAKPSALVALQSAYSGCAPVTVSFKDSSQQGNFPIQNWLWDFGDGNISNSQHPGHTYQNGGTYSVSLQVTDTKGCSDFISKSQYVHIGMPFQVGFTVNGNRACNPPLISNFSPAVSGGTAPYSYSWNFGDGGTSVQSNPSHTYTTTNSFDVTLTVTDANNCSVVRYEPDAASTHGPVANFTTSITQGCSPLGVRFQDASNPSNPAQVSWQSGPFQSQSRDTTVVFTQPGEYDVVWRIYNGGCGDTLVAVKRIRVIQGASVDFTTSDTLICAGTRQVRFVSSGPDIVAWKWDFGNGDVSQNTAANPLTLYSDSTSNYTVSLEVTNKYGCKASVTKPGYVKKHTTRASAGADSIKGCFPISVDFTGSASSLFPIATWTWNFGNGDSAFVQNPTYTYPDTGKHTAILKVTDSAGCSAEATVKVKQGLKPRPAFAGDSLRGCSFNLWTQFTNYTNDSSAIHADSFHWDFGTGEFTLLNTLEDPLYYYHKIPRKYTVTLSAFNNGCKDSLVKTDYIEVLGPFLQVKDFESPCVSTILHKLDMSVAHTRLWKFSDNTSSTDALAYKDFGNNNWWGSLLLRDTISGCMDSMLFQPPYFQPFWAEIQKTSPKCAPADVHFNTILHNVASFVYTFGNGYSTSDTSFSLHVGERGTHWQKLTLYSHDGCTTVYYDSMGIHLQGVDVNGMLSRDSLCVPDSLVMINLSNNPQGIRQQKWIIGDYGEVPLVSDTQSYYLAYPLPNQKTGMMVTLYIEDDSGCNGHASFPLVASQPHPEVSIVQEDDCTVARFRCKITNPQSAGLDPVQYLWNFPNGATSTYTEYLGNFPPDQDNVVTLKSTDAAGCVRNDTFPVFAQNVSVKAGFAAFPTYSSCPPLLVSFTDTSSGGKDSLVSWEWDFGDGTFSTLRHPKKNYLTPGTYSVKLKVTNSKGCTHTILVPSLVIVDGPTGTYTVSPTEGCNTLRSHFAAQTQGASKIEWDLGDGNLGLGDTLTHDYLYPGRFIPLLILSNDMGCKYSLPPIDTIYVRRNPRASFTSEGACSHEANRLLSTSDPIEGIIVELEWWTQGNHIGTGAILDHVFTEAGEHKIRLVCETNFGCFDSIDSVIVISGIKTNLELADSTLCVGSPALFTADIKTYNDFLKELRWDFGDGETITDTALLVEHRYAWIGKYRTTVVSVSGKNCLDTVWSPVLLIGDTLPPPAPDIHRLTVNDALQLEAEHAPSTKVDFFRYILELEEPGFDFNEIKTTYDRWDTLFRHPSLHTREHSYRMRLLEENACGKQTELLESRIHRSVELKTTPDTNAVHLKWNAYAGWDNVALYRIQKEKDNSPGVFYQLDSVPGNILFYTDTMIRCYANPNYRVIAVRGDGVSMVSQSDTSKASPFYKPIVPLHDLLRISVEYDREILAEWRPPVYSRVPIMAYLLEYSKDGRTFSPLGGWMPTSTLSYTRKNLAVDDQSYYFRISCMDSCGDIGPPGTEARSVLLRTSIDSLDRPQLNWSSYQGWGVSPDHYLVERLEPNGQFIVLALVGPNDTSYTDAITEDVGRPDYCYRVTAQLHPENSPEQVWSHSNVSCAPVVSRIFVPNAFTPNGDQLNDSFHLKGMYIFEYEIQIFSRWGELLFESDNFRNSWDGTYKGEAAQQDVYIYIVNAIGTDRKRYHLKGNITLLR